MEFDFEEAKAKIAEFCNPLPACVICQSNDWGLMERVFELAEYYPSSLSVPVIPVIVLVCDNCSYIISFNAIRLGIIEKRAKE